MHEKYNLVWYLTSKISLHQLCSKIIRDLNALTASITTHVSSFEQIYLRSWYTKSGFIGSNVFLNYIALKTEIDCEFALLLNPSNVDKITTNAQMYQKHFFMYEAQT